jgi:phytoene desaturase
MDSKKAIIIGSGVAGMATAIRLAVKGFQVTVYEKNNYPGGNISAFEKDGYYFDAGPSLFVQPANIEELFTLANEPIEKYFSYVPLDISCKYFYEDGKVVQAYTDEKMFAQELQAQLSEQPETVLKYLKESKQLYESVGSIFLNHSLHKTKTWLHKTIRKALAAVKADHLFKSLHKYNSKRFSSPQTVQLFNRYATYNGSNPYKAPGMLSMIPHIEQKGTYYPIGGMISITDAMHKLALKLGVIFSFNEIVERIIHHEGSVKGVVVNKKNILADIVVSNSDIYFTYKNLLANTASPKKTLNQERSSSAVIFYWGIKKEFPQLQLHNIFFSKNYQEEFDCIFERKTISDDPTVYVNITSKIEAGKAPQGKENWFVMVNAPANNGQDWESLKHQLRVIVTSKLSRMLGEDIAIQIETEQTLDPVLIEEQTASYMGSLYGSSSNFKLAAFLRHANFTTSIKGLYFCGGTVHPGGGIPLCLKSAKIVSDLVSDDLKKTKR